MQPAVARRGPASGPTNEALLASVLRASPSAIVALDADGAVALWNPMAERVFGWLADETVGRPPPIPDLSEWAHLAHGATGPTEPDGGSVRRFRRRDGASVAVAVRWAPLHGRDGEEPGTTLIMTPLGGTAGVHGTRDEPPVGPYRLEALSRFAAGVAHDVNNVLTAITGYADLLAAELPGDAPAQADLAEIRGATERATRLTRQLLTFGRSHRASAGPFAVDELITRIEPVLRGLAGSSVELVVVRTAGAAVVLGDRDQFEQVLANLVVNAREAMPGGGQLQIATAEVDLDQAFANRHTGARAGRHVRISVRDSGVGMDDVTLAHLFEPYFTTKPPGRGTGLGLATAYGAVKQGNGYITAQSAPGAGTTMTIFLPSRPPEPTGARAG